MCVANESALGINVMANASNTTTNVTMCDLGWDHYENTSMNLVMFVAIPAFWFMLSFLSLVSLGCMSCCRSSRTRMSSLCGSVFCNVLTFGIGGSLLMVILTIVTSSVNYSMICAPDRADDVHDYVRMYCYVAAIVYVVSTVWTVLARDRARQIQEDHEEEQENVGYSAPAVVQPQPQLTTVPQGAWQLRPASPFGTDRVHAQHTQYQHVHVQAAVTDAPVLGTHIEAGQPHGDEPSAPLHTAGQFTKL